MTTIAILLFEGVEELDFAGPWEVFRVAQGDDPTFDVYTVAEHLEPIRCANGLRVLADRTLADAGRPDVIVVPGGQGTRNARSRRRAVDRRGRPHHPVDDQRLHRLLPARRRRRHRRQARHHVPHRDREPGGARRHRRGAGGRALGAGRQGRDGGRACRPAST